MNIDPGLNEQIKANRESKDKLSVIVTLQHRDDLAVLRQQHGIQPALVYTNIPAFEAQLTCEQIEAIAKLPQVKLVELDQKAGALKQL